MYSSVELLLELIRNALNNSDSVSFPTEADWDAIISTASVYGLDAVSFDGIQAIYDKVSPSDAAKLDESLGERKYDWIGLTLQAERDYEAYCDKLKDLISILNRFDYQVLVLKGYGLSLYYPVPAHRPTGDIDLYLYGFGKDVDELVKTRLRKDVKQNEDKHSTFHYRGLVVENHATFLNVIEHKSLSIIESYLEQNALSAPTISLGGADIRVLSPTMNAVYLPCHIANHFVFGGIHLKQLVDWAVFVIREGRSVDWDLVYKLSKEAGCFDFFRALNEIVIRHLGVPIDCLPDWGTNMDLADKIWVDTLTPKKDLIKRSVLEKVVDYLSARWKYRLVYRECMFFNFFRHGWASFRVKYLPNSRSVWEKPFSK